MNLFFEILISFFVVIGGVFGLVGSFGLVKLSDTMRRLHAPTKATTLGIGGVLIGSMLFFWLEKGHVSLHELMITIFLFLTAPVTANFIAKAYMLHNTFADDLPDTTGEFGWAGYDDPPEQTEE